MTVQELIERLKQMPNLDAEVELFVATGDTTSGKGHLIAGVITDVEYDINLGKSVIASCTYP